MAAYFVKIGNAVANIGEIKFGFTAPNDAYKNIGDELGVTKLDGEGGLTESDQRGIVFGANRPRPPRVRISYKVPNLGGGTANDNIRSVTRYCDPNKLGAVLNGSIRDKQINVDGNDYDIAGVSTPR